jgi:hypothetical protein
MPKVTYDEARGLVQSSGSGFEVNSDVTLAGYSLIGTKLKVITAGTTLTAADSGAVLIPAGGAQTFTLPAPSAGLHFKMYAGSAAAHKIQVPVGAARIYGNGINTNDEQGEQAEGQKISNKSSVAFGAGFLIGDFIEIVCNGTNWFVHAVTNDPLTLVA